jgi:hypothetical protein
MSVFASKNKYQVNYFTLHSEFKKYPINTLMVLSNLQHMKFSLLLLITLFLQNYLFFLICKVGNSRVYLVGLVAFISMSGVSVIKTRKHPSPVRSKTSLGFMGLLDIVYFYILLGTGSELSSFAFATQLQGILFIRMIVLKFIMQHSFWCNHYIGGCIIGVGCVLNFIFFGNRYTYLLLLGMFLHSINGLIKKHYLKKFQVPSESLNKYSLLFATGFGIIITPILSLIVGENIGVGLEAEILCLVGLSCFLMPLYLVALLVSTYLHQFLLKRTVKEVQGQRVVYMFSSVIVFLAFFCAELTENAVNVSVYKLVCAALAISGSIIYHLYPEVPNKFSYAD